MARRYRQTRKQSRKQRGGKRTLSRKASKWAAAVKRVYQQLKREDSSATLRDAMMRASQLKQQGKL